MELYDIAAIVIGRARANSGLTAKGFARVIARDGMGGLHAPIGSEVYALATEHLPEVEPGLDNRLDYREELQKQLWDKLQPELRAYVARCRNR